MKKGRRLQRPKSSDLDFEARWVGLDLLSEVQSLVSDHRSEARWLGLAWISAQRHDGSDLGLEARWFGSDFGLQA